MLSARKQNEPLKRNAVTWTKSQKHRAEPKKPDQSLYMPYDSTEHTEVNLNDRRTSVGGRGLSPVAQGKT